MTDLFTDNAAAAIALSPLRKEAFEAWLAGQPERLRNWIADTGFSADAGSLCLIPGLTGALERVVFGLPETPGLWDWAALPSGLPSGVYALDGDFAAGEVDDAALAWALSGYDFDRYKKSDDDKTPPVLLWPEGCDRAAALRAARFTGLVRNLINTPAADMGPGHLAAAGRDLADEFSADFAVVEGDDLLTENYPAIHAVGRAASGDDHRAPRLIDIRWGNAEAPKLTIVGKGVCFDSGGLDLKSAAGMKLMKKDMGGGAHALGLAGMIMDAGLAVRLRVLVPAVENSVSGNAMRPGDVIATRAGLSVEIGNTDAEGRLVLADALTEATSETPDLIIDFATLTGAARVALGPDLPALFCNDEAVAADILAAGIAADDALWRMPLWPGYRKMVEGSVADLTNSPDSSFAGAITAALFLERFVEASQRWAHIDLMAWNPKSRAGRPEGGEAMGLRGVFAMLAERYGGG